MQPQTKKIAWDFPPYVNPWPGGPFLIGSNKLQSMTGKLGWALIARFRVLDALCCDPRL